MTVRFKDPVSGFSHVGGGVLALFGTAWLVARSGPSGGARTSAVVYGICLVVLYVASSTYHLVIGSERTTRALRLLDHAAIFSMVAGSSTPVLYRALSGHTRVLVLGAMWLTALVGIVLRIAWRGAPRLVYTSVYVAMGWGTVLCAPALVAALSTSVLALFVGGGVVYTCGAVVYALKRPDPFPGRFGFHEIWHLFVLGGSALHFAAIALIV